MNVPCPDERPFLEARTNFEDCRKECFSEFIRGKATDSKTDPKSFWRHINEERKSNTLPSSIIYNNQKGTSNSEKAEPFSEYFQTVYTSHDHDDTLLEFIRNRNDSNCFNIIVTPEIVYSVLSTHRIENY